MKSSVINFTPTEARNPDNLIYVKINLEVHNIWKQKPTNGVELEVEVDVEVHDYVE